MSKLNKKEKQPSAEEALEILLKERADQKYKDRWAKELRGLQGKVDYQEGDRPTLSLRKKVMSIAAAAIFFLLAAFILNSSPTNPVQLAENHLSSLEPFLISEIETRGIKEDYDRQTELVGQLLKNKLYEKVVLIYEKSSLPVNAIDQYYIANALVKAKRPNYSKAIKYLEPLSIEGSLYQYEALWLKSLCHVANGENTQAKLELEKLRSLGSFKSDEIQELLEAME